MSSGDCAVVSRFDASLKRLSDQVVLLFSEAAKCSGGAAAKDKERDRLEALARVEGAIQEQLGYLHGHVVDLGSSGFPPLEFRVAIQFWPSF